MIYCVNTIQIIKTVFMQDDYTLWVTITTL